MAFIMNSPLKIATLFFQRIEHLRNYSSMSLDAFAETITISWSGG